MLIPLQLFKRNVFNIFRVNQFSRLQYPHLFARIMSLRRSSRISDKASKVAEATNDDATAPRPNISKKRKERDPSPEPPKAAPKKAASKKAVTKTVKAPIAAKTAKAAKAASRSKVAVDEEPIPPPTTPAKKRKAAAPSPPKTPATVGILSSPAIKQPGDSSLTPSQARPAEPHATNAPLATPGGSRVLAYDKLANGPWEAAVNLPLPTTTTKELLKEAEAHLISVDPGLKKVIEKFPCRIFSPEGLAEAVEPWKNLASMIMAQQVSGAAAKSIKNKFISLFPSPDSSNESYFPHPSAVAAANVEYLRTAGLSGRKAEYIQGVAERFASGELSARMLVHATDEEVMKTLVAIRGLGKWSVEMFECFTLKRMDVFSTGDLGVQRGMAVWQGKDVNKLKGKSGKWKYMSEEDMLEHSAKFAPYRSLFMWYMWKMEDVNIDAIAT